MATTFSQLASLVFWNGTTYDYTGEMAAAIPDGTDFIQLPAVSKAMLAAVPHTSSITFRMLTLDLNDSGAASTVPPQSKQFDQGFD